MPPPPDPPGGGFLLRPHAKALQMPGDRKPGIHVTSTTPTLAQKLETMRAKWGDRIRIVEPANAQHGYGLGTHIATLILATIVSLLVIGYGVASGMTKSCTNTTEDEFSPMRIVQRPLFATPAPTQQCDVRDLTFNATDMDSVPAQVLFGIPIGLAGLVGTLALAGRRRKLYSAAAPASNPSGPYALYLRSFVADTASHSGLGNVRGEAETIAVEAFAPIGPSIALDNVSNAGVTGGALRIQTDHDIWRDVVKDLGRDAVMMWLDASHTTLSLRDEIGYFFDFENPVCTRGALFILGDRKARLSHLDYIKALVEGNGGAFAPIDRSAPPIMLLMSGRDVTSIACSARNATASHLRDALRSKTAQKFLAGS